MNLNDYELERALSSLRPLAPSVEVAHAIERELTHRGRAPAARVPSAAILNHRGQRRSGFGEILRALGWALAGGCAALLAIVLTEQAPYISCLAAKRVFDRGADSFHPCRIQR